MNLTNLLNQPLSQWISRSGLSLTAAALLAGCANSHPHMTLDTVGPAPVSATSTSGHGRLVVYSDPQTVYDSDALVNGSSDDWSPSSYTWEYSGYKILAPDGSLFKHVENNVGSSVLQPRQIELPAGKYSVIAASHGYGCVAVPVVINGNQVTVVHLDSDGFIPNDYGFNSTNSVHLPDGRIVGWRANADDKHGATTITLNLGK